MREKQLSKRLRAVADLVSPGMRVADVGCDHAYVSIYLVKNGIAVSCLAMDLREGPLLQAGKNIRAYGMEGSIETRLSAGLTAVLPGEVDAVLMAGMGGILIRDILREKQDVSGTLKEWILQPQSDVALVRGYIREAGYRIVRENMVKEDGKYYPMFRAVPLGEEGLRAAGKRPDRRASKENELAADTVREDAEVSGEKRLAAAGEGENTNVSGEKRAADDREIFDRFGELLLKERNPVLKEFLDYGTQHYGRIIRSMERQEKPDGRTLERLNQMKQEAEYIRCALEWYGR